MAKSRRANAVVFGFDFQVNAAIVLMIENIEDLKSLRLRRNPDGGGKSEVASRNAAEDFAEREVHWGCPFTENLYGGFPLEKESQEQRHCPTILCGGQP